MTENESQRQWRDVLGVLKLQGDRLDFEYLQKWAMELELRDLLATACVESGLEAIQNLSTTANPSANKLRANRENPLKWVEGDHQPVKCRLSHAQPTKRSFLIFNS